jgi:hypothetical protein
LDRPTSVAICPMWSLVRYPTTTLSELDTFLVYGHYGTSSSRGDTFISMDLKTMLGYLTEFQLDTPRFLKKDFPPVIPENIEKEN